MVKPRTAIVIDETQLALLVAGAAVSVMTPFTDVEIRLSPTKPYVRHEGTGGRPALSAAARGASRQRTTHRQRSA